MEDRDPKIVMAPQCQTDFVPRATFRNSRERPGTLWRRWTGIEPAGRGSPVPAALKAVEPTRCPDTSEPEHTAHLCHTVALWSKPMKKLLLLVVVAGLAALAIKKVRSA